MFSIFSRESRYKFVNDSGASVEFMDLKSGQNKTMDAVEIVHQGLIELFNDDERARVGNIAARKDPSVTVENNKGSVSVFSFNRLYYYPFFFSFYVCVSFITYLFTPYGFSVFGMSFPFSMFLFISSIMMVDIVTELFGFHKGFALILHGSAFTFILGAVLYLILIFVSMSSSKVPPELLLSLPSQLMIGSVMSLIISFVDLSFFVLFKKRFYNYRFWFRSITSSIISQIMNGIMFSLFVVFISQTVTPSVSFVNSSVKVTVMGFFIAVLYLSLSCSIIWAVKKKER